MMRWVRRNQDKPHRCPECHAVATHDRNHIGPRTRLVCPMGCGVQWRAGFRQQRDNMAWKAWYKSLTNCKCSH